MGTKQQPNRDPEMQGEGNRTADRKYRESATRHAESGKSADAARQAERALEGGEREELSKAERDAKAGKQSSSR